MCPVSWVMVENAGYEERAEASAVPDVLKGFGGSVPIVVLGGQSGVEDRMLLLELGEDANKNVVNPKELLARVRRAMEQLAASARGESKPDREVVSFGDARIDFTSMEASRAGRPVMLTKQEFKVIRFFAKHPNRAVSRDVLLNEVWGYNNYPSTRTVDNHLLRLRHKLEPDPARPQFFLTIHGAGYKFVPEGTSLAQCG